MRKLITPVIASVASVVIIAGCSSQPNTVAVDTAPKALPADIAEKPIELFVGQDLGAVGGLKDYDQGYVDYFGIPSGVTVYTSLKDLEGLEQKVNYGAGDNHVNLYLESDAFKGVDIAMGLYLVDQLDDINAGKLDSNISKLANWISQSERTVYLRIGYEFEGSWNGYASDDYKEAYRRIVDGLNKLNIDNVEYVWQSSGYEEDREELLSYYPGDAYVDWVAYSYFNHDPKLAGQEMLRIARERGKPVMIAELTPRGYNLMLDDGKKTWDSWFKPFLNHLKENQDVIKIIAYINADWDVQPMWKGQGWGDTRLQSNLYIANKWRRTIKREEWLVTSTVVIPPIFLLPDDYDELKQARNKTAEDTVPQENQWQAEDATPTGNVRIYPDGAATGGKGMAYMYQQGDSLTFNGVPQSNYFVIRYASERSGKIGLFVNGQRAYDIEFDSTGSWVGTYNKVEMRVDIPEGADVAIKWETGDTALNTDYVVFDRR
ncbi:glycosyl hydrolase [Vibrio maritimus]|uniref:glycosyl hydrolase n=1 Tax=Vibrio maritimus TaxID=990268 RepID=UPI0040683068